MHQRDISRQQHDLVARFWQAGSRRTEVEHAALEIRASKLKAATEEIEAREKPVASLQAEVQKAIAQARDLAELPKSAAFVPSETANHPVHEHQRSVEQVGLALQSLRHSSEAIAAAKAEHKQQMVAVVTILIVFIYVAAKLVAA